MSWDIVIFSSNQKINSVQEINEELFLPTDFGAILEKHFNNIIIDEDHREIKGNDYAINYFVDTNSVSNKLFSLYGKNALFELIGVAKIYHWQIFDAGSGEMLDLEHPEKNGYDDFQKYRQHILKNDDPQ